MSNSLKLRPIPLSKLFFYALVLALPFNIVWPRFTETSFYFGFHAFYNTVFISLTDLIICGLVLSWAIEFIISQKHSPLPPPYLKGEENAGTAPPLKVRGGWEGLLHRIYTAISQDILIRSTVIFWLILAISTIISQKQVPNWYGFVKWTEFLVVFLYAGQYVSVKPNPLAPPYLKGEENAGTAPPLKLRGGWEGLLWLFVIGAVIQSIIGISQYFSQHSLGLQYFGETFFAPAMKGIAQFHSREMVIRAYGTFPHPNVLGAWLFLGFLSVIWLIYAQCGIVSKETIPTSNPSPRRGEGGPSTLGGEGRVVSILREIFLSLSLLLISTGLVLTFSRTAWAVTALALGALFIAGRFHRNRIWQKMQTAQRATGAETYRPLRLLVIGLLFTASLGLNLYLFGGQIRDRISPPREEGTGEVKVFHDPFLISPSRGGENSALTDRQLYSSIAWQMIRDHPIFGLGMRNLVSRMDEFNIGERLLPHQHQPVHNIYLLLWAETGLLGLAAFLYLLYSILRCALSKLSIINYQLLVIFTAFLFLGFFDHYFFSLNQGGLMFWLVAGLLAGE